MGTCLFCFVVGGARRLMCCGSVRFECCAGVFRRPGRYGLLMKAASSGCVCGAVGRLLSCLATGAEGSYPSRLD